MSSNLSSSFLSNFFNAISNGILNKNSVSDRSVHTGMMNVPYASMGLITVAVGTFTYVTYMDYINDNVTDTLDDKPQDDNSDYSFGVLNSLGISSDETKIQENPENDNNIFFPNTKPEVQVHEETKPEVQVHEETKPEVQVPEETKPEVQVTNPEEQKNKKEDQPGERYSIGGGKKHAHKKTNKKRR